MLGTYLMIYSLLVRRGEGGGVEYDLNELVGLLQLNREDNIFIFLAMIEDS